jgi:hypothetical protein
MSFYLWLAAVCLGIMIGMSMVGVAVYAMTRTLQ